VEKKKNVSSKMSDAWKALRQSINESNDQVKKHVGRAKTADKKAKTAIAEFRQTHGNNFPNNVLLLIGVPEDKLNYAEEQNKKVSSIKKAASKVENYDTLFKLAGEAAAAEKEAKEAAETADQISAELADKLGKFRSSRSTPVAVNVTEHVPTQGKVAQTAPVAAPPSAGEGSEPDMDLIGAAETLAAPDPVVAELVETAEEILKENELVESDNNDGGTSARTMPVKRKKKSSAKKRPAVVPTERTRRARPGTVALREIRRYQNGTDLLLRRAPFQRVVREVTEGIAPKTGEVRWRASALEALQHGTEAYLTDLLADANLAAIHSKRITIAPKDIKLVRRISESPGGVKKNFRRLQ
jgi:histone H3-like centromeric protein A